MDIQNEPVSVAKIDDGFRVSVLGSVHVNTAWLEGVLKKVAEANPRLLELDLAQCPYVSSAGMGVLVAARRAILDRGGELRIVAIQKMVLQSMRFGGLDAVFKIPPTAVVPG
jgi:anti-anti-sigma factor